MSQRDADRWRGFMAFWLLGGVILLTLGIATFAAVRHGHRVGALIACGGIICLAIGFIVRQASARREQPSR